MPAFAGSNPATPANPLFDDFVQSLAFQPMISVTLGNAGDGSFVNGCNDAALLLAQASNKAYSDTK